MTVPEIEGLRTRLIGHRFPVGRTVVPSYEAWLGNDAMKAPVSQRTELGPMWSMIAGYRGMGTTIEELLRLAESAPDQGIMFGELATFHTRDLRCDTEYAVRCEIVDIERKAGARIGVFDILTFEIRIYENETEEVSAVRSSFILPRKAA